MKISRNDSIALATTSLRIRVTITSSITNTINIIIKWYRNMNSNQHILNVCTMYMLYGNINAYGVDSVVKYRIYNNINKLIIVTTTYSTVVSVSKIRDSESKLGFRSDLGKS